MQISKAICMHVLNPSTFWQMPLLEHTATMEQVTVNMPEELKTIEKIKQKNGRSITQ